MPNDAQLTLFDYDSGVAKIIICNDADYDWNIRYVNEDGDLVDITPPKNGQCEELPLASAVLVRNGNFNPNFRTPFRYLVSEVINRR